MINHTFTDSFSTILNDKFAFINTVIAYSKAKQYNYCYLENNGIIYPYGGFENAIFISFSNQNLVNEPQKFSQNIENFNYSKELIFGYLTYDLKNQLEDLESTNQDLLKSPDVFFSKADDLILFTKDFLTVFTNGSAYSFFESVSDYRYSLPKSIISTINQTVTKTEYIKNVTLIKEHILNGDIYELNYCIEFYAKDVEINELEFFRVLNEYSPMPFASISSFSDISIISASPERFLKSQGSKLISQPIKGTAKRSLQPEEDAMLKANLETSEKEIAENMMIVDLVRNDLAKNAITGTVTVEEAFKVYTFRKVHQMISTVTASKKHDVHPFKIVLDAFPMGSMTGAPKIKAMQLIEKYEKSKRGIYSGSIGYVDTLGNFDFNVVIRSLIYNRKEKILSFSVGSAITYDSDIEKEYEECLLKAEAILHTLTLMS